MPVDSQHDDYARGHERWERCRDCHEGEDAIKAKREKYLPRLSGQDDTPDGRKAYESYLLRAMFHPALGRTIGGLMGAILRKPPAQQGTEGIMAQLDDLTKTGRSIVGFTIDVLQEVLTVGRCGVLVDMAQSKGDGSSVTGRPHWVLYRAEQIINWRSKTVRVDGEEREVPTLVVLHEGVPDAARSDKFKTETQPQYRVLELVAEPDGKVAYAITLWRKATPDAKEWTIAQEIRPTRRGVPLEEIPFVFIGPRNNAPDIDKPPLLDLANVNISHFRSSADLETGCHYTAIPTPVVSGYRGQDALRIGPTTAWTLEDPQARATYLEFTGQGLQALETRQEKKETLMAVIGARLLDAGPKQQETAEAVRTRHSGERATLTTITTAVSEGFTQALQWHVWWNGSDRPDSETSIAMNTEFVETLMTPQDRQATVLEWQTGLISKRTAYYNLQRGGVARPDVSFEDEQQEIASEEPDDALGGAQPPLEPTREDDDPSEDDDDTAV